MSNPTPQPIPVRSVQYSLAGGFFNRLKLGRKLGLAFSLLVALTLILGAGSVAGGVLETQAERRVRAADNLVSITEALIIETLSMRRVEEKFELQYLEEGYEIASQNYLTPFDQHRQTALAHLARIRDGLNNQIAANPSNPAVLARLQTDLRDVQLAEQAVNDYAEFFQRLAEQNQQRGNLESGLVFEADQARKQLDKTLAAVTEEGELVLRHEIHELALLYILNPNAELLVEIRAELDDLKGDIAAHPSLTAAEARALNTQVDALTTALNELALLEQELHETRDVLSYDAQFVVLLAEEIVVDQEFNANLAQAEFDTIAASVLAFDIALPILGLALGILLALVITRSIAEPVGELTTVAQSLAGGNLNVRARADKDDEVGLLARAFNAMAGQLQELIGSLEQRVADRTRDLEAAQAIMAKRAGELQSVAEISTKASLSTTIQEMLQTVVDLTKSSYSLYHAHVYLLDETKTKLVLAAGAGEVGRKMVGEKRAIALDHQHSLVARAARTVQGAISNDVANEPDFLPNPFLPDTKAEMAIPVAIGDTLLGVLDVQADYVNRFTDEDIAIKTTLAQQIATSLENLRQYQISQKVARELGVVAAVSTATATITDTNRLLQEVVDRTKEAFSLYHAHIYLLNEAGDTLELAAGAGEIGRQMVSEGRQIPLDSEKSLVARAARTRVGAVVNDVRSEPDFLPNPLLPETKSEQAVPMIVGDTVLGVLDVQSEQLNRFSEIDVNIKTTLAAQVAVAVQNARTFAQAQSQAQREVMVNVINQKIQSATSVEAVLQIAARELGRALNAPLTVAQLGVGARNGGNGNGNGNNR